MHYRNKISLLTIECTKERLNCKYTCKNSDLFHKAICILLVICSESQPFDDPIGSKNVAVWIFYTVVFDGHLFTRYSITFFFVVVRYKWSVCSRTTCCPLARRLWKALVSLLSRQTGTRLESISAPPPMGWASRSPKTSLWTCCVSDNCPLTYYQLLRHLYLCYMFCLKLFDIWSVLSVVIPTE